jgi:hypothetical protein
MTEIEKKRAYRTRKALGIIRRSQPKTIDEARAALGMSCRKVGQGAFRTAHRIYGTDLLIKFPFQYKAEGEPGEGSKWTTWDGVNHTRMEVKKIRALMKFPLMRKHLPPIYYFNGRDGVVVTRYYPKPKGIMGATNELVAEMIYKFCGVVLGDIAPDNVRTTRGPNLIFTDLGY